MKLKLFIWLLLIASITWMIVKNNWMASDTKRDVIREARMKACATAYWEYQDRIKERYIHTDQNWIVRCFAYMSIVYAKETWFWNSRMCVQDNNCHWLKQMTYDIRIPYTVWNNRFVIFQNPEDSNLAFARLFARFHMNKNADVFVKWVWVNWQRVWAYSQTDQDTYVKFIQDNFQKFYDIGHGLAFERINK